MQPQITRIYKSGRNQVVRLPKEFCFENDEILIQKKGDDIILSPLPKSWNTFFKQTPLPSEDFMSSRVDLQGQMREDIF